jgi:hypothetical protein
MSPAGTIDEGLRLFRLKTLLRSISAHLSHGWPTVTTNVQSDEILTLWEELGMRGQLYIENKIPWDSLEVKEAVKSLPNAFMRSSDDEPWKPLRFRTGMYEGPDVMGLARELFCMAVSLVNSAENSENRYAS